MNRLSYTKTITYTSIMLALLVCVQMFSKSFGQLVTGSLINLILMITVMCFGLIPATIISIISPFISFMLGSGTHIIQVVPIISLGNFMYVLVSNYLMNINKYLRVIIASTIKFLVLYFVIVKFILPTLNLSIQTYTAISLTFSYIQLINALLGGIIASNIGTRIKSTIK